MIEDNDVARPDSELTRIIGKFIAKHRHNVALTQSQLAEHLGISIDAMSRIKREENMPTVSRLVQLTEVFDCEANNFLLQKFSPLINAQTL